MSACDHPGMFTPVSSRLDFKAYKKLLAMGPLVLALAGCSMVRDIGTGAGTAGTASSSSTIGGKAFGGRQAIYNATVTLYAMNTSTANYGDTPTAYAQTTTDVTGHFTFVKGVDGVPNTGTTPAFSCPANASTAAAGTADNPFMYIVASGGDTSGSINLSNIGSAYNNTAAKLILAGIDCNSLSAATQVVMNEVTTVGTMVAMQQFFNPMNEALGAPSTNITGLKNAIAMVSNLVDAGTGVALQNTSVSSSVAGVSVVATPEYQKLNTMANILAACVSSSSASSAACQALATNAVPPPHASATNFPSISSYPSATDTLLAIDYMNTNPTESQDYGATGKFNNLYTLPALGTAPFQPALTAQPMDWAVSIAYTVSGTCTNTVTVTGTTPGSQAFLMGAYGLAVDKDGNVWLGGSGGSVASGVGDVLARISPTGEPQLCLNYGDTQTAGRKIAIDTLGNVFWGTNQGLMEYVGDSSNAAYGTMLRHPLPSGIHIAGVAVDTTGNAFIAPDSTLGRIYEYSNAGTATAPVTAVTIGDTDMPLAGAPYQNVVLDSAGHLFTHGSGTSSGQVFMYTNTGSAYTDLKLSVSGVSTPYGLAQLSNGNIVGGNTCCANAGRLYQFSNVDGSSVSKSGLYAGGTTGTRGLAVDGADNIWQGSGTYPADAAGTIFPLGVTDVNYNPISPQGVTPSTCGSAAPSYCQTLGGYQRPWMTTSMYAMAPDGSGNFWIALSGNYYVFVGAAVPIKTPIANNIH